MYSLSWCLLSILSPYIKSLQNKVGCIHLYSVLAAPSCVKLFSKDCSLNPHPYFPILQLNCQYWLTRQLILVIDRDTSGEDFDVQWQFSYVSGSERKSLSFSKAQRKICAWPCRFKANLTESFEALSLHLMKPR